MAFPSFLAFPAALFLTACQDSPVPAPGATEIDHPPEQAVIRHVIVVAMENVDAGAIYGNSTRAPYLNDTLLAKYAHATNFIDVLPAWVPSEPHYVWMEAGTNALPDHVFEDNSDPSILNSTASSAQLVAQIRRDASHDWMTYQEGLNAETGPCPIVYSGFYAAKHNPFVFFRDVTGSPPSKSNAYCASHHRPLSALAADLAADSLAAYVFVTPDLCHDMHGDYGCPAGDELRAGDDWLRAHLPPLIASAEAHDGAIFIVWDEGGGTNRIPFIAVGPGVKKGYAGTKTYTHSSLVKSVERILGLPYLSTAAKANDFSDLFEKGKFP
jgi:hypothetical protein